MLKKCKICSVVKPIEDFYSLSKARSAHGDGHDARCKSCAKLAQSTPDKRIRANELRRKRGKSEKCKEANRQWAKTEAGKKCQRAKGKRHYWKHRDKLLAQQAIFRQTEAFKISIEQNRLKYPEKREAHIKVSNAIARGHLIRPEKCTICFAECKPDAHHFDYSQPLNVIWACKKCHNAFHSCA